MNYLDTLTRFGEDAPAIFVPITKKASRQLNQAGRALLKQKGQLHAKPVVHQYPSASAPRTHSFGYRAKQAAMFGFPLAYGAFLGRVVYPKMGVVHGVASGAGVIMGMYGGAVTALEVARAFDQGLAGMKFAESGAIAGAIGGGAAVSASTGDGWKAGAINGGVSALGVSVIDRFWKPAPWKPE